MRCDQPVSFFDFWRGGTPVGAPLDACQCLSPTVQPWRQVSLRYPWLCSASEFSRGVPGFKILIKSYLKPETKDSPGVPLRKTALFVYVQNDAKKRHTDSAKRVVHVMRFVPPLTCLCLCYTGYAIYYYETEHHLQHHLPAQNIPK